jgi:hypothetical protein
MFIYHAQMQTHISVRACMCVCVCVRARVRTCYINLAIAKFKITMITPWSARADHTIGSSAWSAAYEHAECYAGCVRAKVPLS